MVKYRGRITRGGIIRGGRRKKWVQRNRKRKRYKAQTILDGRETVVREKKVDEEMRDGCEKETTATDGGEKKTPATDGGEKKTPTTNEYDQEVVTRVESEGVVGGVQSTMGEDEGVVLGVQSMKEDVGAVGGGLQSTKDQRAEDGGVVESMGNEEAAVIGEEELCLKEVIWPRKMRQQSLHAPAATQRQHRQLTMHELELGK